jgi:GT2 family glycosyltransferase
MERGDVVFSIVIPTRNRPGQLADCLEAIAALEYPRERFEVLVVDDGSEISVEAVVAAFRDRLAVVLVTQPHQGPAAARNSGAARAQGKVLAFTDDDCVPDPGWLQALAARFAAAPADGVGGKTLNDVPTNLYASASQLIVDVGYDYFNADPGQAGFFAANNLALPVDRFRQVGGFDESFRTYEDRDLCNRWRDRGWQMTYAPDALLRHRHRLTLRSFWQQHYRYGRGAWRFHRARASRGSDRLRPDRLRPDPRFYWQLVRRAAGTVGERRIRLLGLVLLAQGANAAGFLGQALRGL